MFVNQHTPRRNARIREIRISFVLSAVLAAALFHSPPLAPAAPGDSIKTASAPLAKIHVAPDGRTFVTVKGTPFVPFGVNYYRPGTGWAPQVWKKFDAEAARSDFARMKELGVNCVRVFLSYGSFCSEFGVLDTNGLAKFDQFLAIAEAAGIYVHPTGPDHWEGTPEWTRVDRIADERTLRGLELFWKEFAARYRNRAVIFAYDLRNEPAVLWDTPPLREKWNRWVTQQYKSIDELSRAWNGTNRTLRFGELSAPQPKSAGERELRDYQLFREEVADEWTRRQVATIKAVDPNALVTVGLIQWSVPSLLPRVEHYSGFRPERQARLLDFLEVHFYPLDHGAYEYRSEEEEARNLAYLESVVREVARPDKPVVLAEFGWYGGGGKPKFDGGRHPAATEEQQARWCRRVVETTAGLAVGWLNWGFYDQPEATDVSELTGLLTAEGKLKVWGEDFQKLSARYSNQALSRPKLVARPVLDWERCIVNPAAGNAFREQYYQAWKKDFAAAAEPLPKTANVQASQRNSAGKVRVEPREIDDLFANPGMGWQTFHHFADEDKNLQGLPSGSAYFRFYWRELEPQDGKIDFAKFDELLAHAHRAGQKLAFRIMCTGSGEYTDVPAWLREQGCKGVEFMYGGRRHWVPDFSDPLFQQKHFRLIRELGRRYDGHADLDLVDIGSVGLWGEWHMSSTTGVETGKPVPMPSIELRQAIIDEWRRAFPKTPKVVLIGSEEGMSRAMKDGLGWRADCLGDMGGFSKRWNHMDNFYMQQIEKTGASDAWKAAPVAFESCWDMRKWKEEGWDISHIFDYALRCHASYMNNKSAAIPEGSRGEVEKFLRCLGYRLVIRRIEHDATVRNGERFAVNVAWENVGVAPPYRDYRIAVRVTDRQQRKTVLVTDESIRGWLPGAHQTELMLTLPRSLAPTDYQLAVGVVDVTTQTPAVRLAIAGRDADGWYPVSRFEVTKPE